MFPMTRCRKVLLFVAVIALLVFVFAGCADKQGSVSPTRMAGSASNQQESPRYNPNGPDRDCDDFKNWHEVNVFYEAAGGPESDPHRLDRDRDGIPCEAFLNW